MGYFQTGGEFCAYFEFLQKANGAYQRTPKIFSTGCKYWLVCECILKLPLLFGGIGGNKNYCDIV